MSGKNAKSGPWYKVRFDPLMTDNRLRLQALILNFVGGQIGIDLILEQHPFLAQFGQMLV